METKDMNKEEPQKRKLLSLMRKLSEVQANNMMLTAKITARSGKEQVNEKVSAAKEKIELGAKRYGQKMEKIQEQYNLNKEEKGNILFEYKESLEEINNEYEERIKLALDQKQELEVEEQNLLLEETELKNAKEEMKLSPEYKEYKENEEKRIIEIKNDLDHGNLDDVGIKNEELKQYKKNNPLVKYNEAIEAVRNQRHEISDLIEKCEQEIEAYEEAREMHINEVAEDKDNKLALIQKQSLIQKMTGMLFNRINGAKKFKDNVMDVISKKVDKIKNEDLPKVKESAGEKKTKFVENMRDRKEVINEKASRGKEAVKGKASSVKEGMISAKDKVADVSKQSYSTMVSKGKAVKSRVADKFENMINNAENRNQELNNKYYEKESNGKDER